MPATVIIRTADQRARALHWCSKAPEGTRVVFHKPGRTLPQNDRFWAMLTDVARQAEHNGNRYTPEQWKALFLHACGQETHFMPGLNGDPFPAGFRSSKLTVAQMGEVMDFIEAWGAQNGVRFSDE